ncbi:MAG: ornithine cyclodeaminase family protein [Anaerolineales bacterium]|nr:ornithine cyclodeaminase family protein [Anaerolineales bacterium]
MVTLITEAEVRAVLTMDLALEAVETAFRSFAAEPGRNLARRRVSVPGGRLHLMAAVVPEVNALGLKAYATFSGPVDFLTPLYAADTGRLLALIEADWLGRMRTGAASGVATRYLARPDARALGLFGTGGQAQTQLLAVCVVRPIERVHVYSRSAERRAAFVAAMQPRVSAQLIAVDDPRAAVEDMDVVTTMTTSAQPVFEGAWLSPGAHLNAAGSNQLRRREVDAATFRRAACVTADSVEQARLESGDLVGAVAEGALAWEQVVDLAEVLAGRAPGRVTPADITVFESHGLAVWDVAAAALVYARAVERGLGRPLPLFERLSAD